MWTWSIGMWKLKYTSIASISYDGMTSHCDVMTRRCDTLAAAFENSIDDLFDTNNPNKHRICIVISVWLNYKTSKIKYKSVIWYPASIRLLKVYSDAALLPSWFNW